MTAAGTWSLTVVDPGCGCCSYLTVETFRSKSAARKALAARGDGYVLDFEPDDDEDKS